MTLYVGIDVSKFKNDLAILEDQGEIITKNLRFDNSSQGFQISKDHLDALVIVRRLLTDSCSERFKVKPQMRELKELTRYQNRLIHDRSKAKILYVRVFSLNYLKL